MLRDLLPAAVALSDDAGRREVDLHLIAPTPDGGGDQVLPGGGAFRYGPPTVGRIGGRPVPCCSAETQVRAHLGYPPSEVDHRDMALLQRRLGVALPPPYAEPPG